MPHYGGRSFGERIRETHKRLHAAESPLDSNDLKLRASRVLGSDEILTKRRRMTPIPEPMTMAATLAKLSATKDLVVKDTFGTFTETTAASRVISVYYTRDELCGEG